MCKEFIVMRHNAGHSTVHIDAQWENFTCLVSSLLKPLQKFHSLLALFGRMLYAKKKIG